MSPIPPVDLPKSLEGQWDQVSGKLAELPVDLLAGTEAVAATVSRVAVCSDFVLATLLQQPGTLVERLAEPDPLRETDLRQQLELGACSESDAMSRLRRFRHVEMARIAWRDLSGWADLETNLEDLSLLADFSVCAALRFASDQLASRYGRPIDREGKELPLLILGMGKLGGYELNYSSDIDLVFLHPDGVEISGLRNIDIEGYYRRLAQLLVKLLDNVTADGFVFRVDTRLRPFGKSGPLTVGISAFETYLVRHGRDWERYAYLKARLLTGQEYESEVFDEILTPFVYRRYIDFGVFGALRHMKALIVREVARRDMADNIKLGSGGIREIEFIVQASQLVRGGRDPSLRERSLLTVLPGIVGSRQLTVAAAAALAEAYRYLRALENRLQAMNDKQLHNLPTDELTCARLAYAMQEPDWATLVEHLTAHRRLVEEQFAGVAFEEQDDSAAVTEPGTSLVAWEGAWEASEFVAYLEETDLEQTDEILSVLKDVRDGPLYQRMDELSRQRLSATMYRILPLLDNDQRPAETLSRVLPLIRAICRRSAYLALLNENPEALARLLALARQSEFLIRLVTSYPLLLDELLDPRIFETPPSRRELENALQRGADLASATDVEQRLEALRQFQRTAMFRIAVADQFGHLPVMKVSDRLTDTAEIVLQFAFDTAWTELETRHGRPMCGDESSLSEAGFVVIGYGKLGGYELGYGSDLDLVFLHDSHGTNQETDGESATSNERFFMRLAQRMIHFLGMQTSSGRLYEIDTRLRPSGDSGFMVTSMDAFRRYQHKEAWVWEHQALLRSRSVAGSAKLREQFEAERREILTSHVNRTDLKSEIVRMRQRMRKELSESRDGQFDIKQDRGGLADIEFLVDYWVLQNASQRPELIAYPDNVRQLEELEHAKLVSADLCAKLTSIYLELRECSHNLALNDAGRTVEDPRFEAERAWVKSVWDDVFAE
ncbi:MAG: bifunctional [glutamate--ammonia ligase]-adenylyl-L-tyrosine phosphorylase/[glutamate--ammonia-ligase] adenylyltransferase [Candidatus Rariloculaceae bacterium]